MLGHHSKKQFSDSIQREAELMLKRLESAQCPVWRFHYLGAISAYLQLAKNLESLLGKATTRALRMLEEQALLSVQSRVEVSVH